MLTGGCQCGAIRYEVDGEVTGHSLCHCRDCRRSAGAPMVGWMMVPEAQFRLVAGTPTAFASSADARRHFCGACGTGIFYLNAAALPGQVDIQSGTLDDPEAVPPTDQIQVAERLSWMTTAHLLPAHHRFPGMD